MEDDFEKIIEAQAQLESLKKESDALLALRKCNSLKQVQIARREQDKLKSDLKKATTFVKKIRVITSEGLQQCARDVETLNLTLYVSEIVAALIECNFKATDVSVVVDICCKLHQRYDDFTSPLISGLKESLLDGAEEEDSKKKRMQLRLIIELFQVGLFVESDFFCQLLQHLVGRNSKSGAKSQIDLAGLVVFAKYGHSVLLGYHPKRVQSLARVAGKKLSDIPCLVLSAPNVCQELRSVLDLAMARMSEDLVRVHRDYCTREKRNNKDKLLHGSLSEQKLAETEACKRTYEKLLSTVTAVAEVTGKDVVSLQEEEEGAAEGGGGGGEEGKGISVWEGAGGGCTDFGPYGDAETMAFYEELPDLLAAVPLSVLGLTVEQAQSLKESWKVVKEFDVPQDLSDASMMGDDAEEGAKGAAAEEEVPSAGATAVGTVPDDGEDEAALGTPLAPSSTNASAGGASIAPIVTNHTKLVTLLTEKLPECVTRQKCDDFCASFCYCNGKKARKHLVSALLDVPRNRLELIPNYARITASLSRLYSDLSGPIVESLMRQFYGILRSKNQQNIQGKLKNMKFIGELVKFKVAPPVTALKCFNRLLMDFVHHSIEMCSSLMETCGRYLYLMEVTGPHMEQILDSVMRLRRAKNIDVRHQMVLESAYYAVKPPDRKVKQKKQYTMIQSYTRDLILKRLNSDTVEFVIKQLRKLPWVESDEKKVSHEGEVKNEDGSSPPTAPVMQNIEYHVVKASLKLARSKYTNVPVVADCLSGLSRYQPNLMVRLVDSLFEEVLRGFDTPYKREQQRMLSYIRLFAELYNYNVISANVIFDLLFLCITYGYNEMIPAAVVGMMPSGSVVLSSSGGSSLAAGAMSVAGSVTVVSSVSALVAYHNNKCFDATTPTELDPQNDCFRIQLCCELLTSCGSYFMKGSTRVKLDEFLLCFQRYILLKYTLPSYIEFMILDLFDSLEQFCLEDLKRDKKVIPSGGKNSKPVTHFPRYDADSFAELQSKILETESKKQDLIVKSGTEAGVAIVDDGDEEDVENCEDEDEDGEGPGGGRGKSGGRRDRGEVESDKGEDCPEEDDVDAVQQQAEDARQLLEYEESLRRQEAVQAMERTRVRAEEDEFDKAFKALMLESVESAKSTSGVSRFSQVDKMTMPAILPKPKNLVPTRGDNNSDSDDGSDDEALPKSKVEEKRIPFKLLSRDAKGRFETRQLMVPGSSSIAVKASHQEVSQKIEREKVKEKVLLLSLSATEPLEPSAYMPFEGRGASGNVPISAPSSLQQSQPSTASMHKGYTGYTVEFAGSRHRTDGPKAQDYKPHSEHASSKSDHSKGGASSSRGSSQKHTAPPHESKRAANTLDFDGFLAEASASETRRLNSSSGYQRR